MLEYYFHLKFIEQIEEYLGDSFWARRKPEAIYKSEYTKFKPTEVNNINMVKDQ